MCLHLAKAAMLDARVVHRRSCRIHASCHRQLPARMLVEVVRDKGRPMVLRFSDSSAEELPVCIDIPDALAKLVASADCGEDCLTLYSTESKTVISACVAI